MWKNIPTLTKFDIVDFIDSEEYAKGYLWVWTEDNGAKIGTPEDIDDVWEDIKRASERHGFPITPALQDTYAEVRAVCADIHSAAEPAFA